MQALSQLSYTPNKELNYTDYRIPCKEASFREKQTGSEYTEIEAGCQTAPRISRAGDFGYTS